MTHRDSGQVPETPAVLSRRQAIKAGTLVAGVAWIAPVMTPVPLFSSLAEAASGASWDDPGSYVDPDPKTPTGVVTNTPTSVTDTPTSVTDPPSPTTNVPNQVTTLAPPPAVPADETVQVLSESQSRSPGPSASEGRVGTAPVATATAASARFVG